MLKKFLDIKEAAALAENARKNSKTVALANGAFDILHVGHIRYLQASKECADLLIVAVNSDSSVRGYKGEGRPVIPDHERAELICALECVDHVVIFPELTVENVIRQIRPDFQCKGTDYTEDSVPEGDLVRSLGGAVKIVGDPKDHDSSAIIRKINRAG